MVEVLISMSSVICGGGEVASGWLWWTSFGDCGLEKGGEEGGCCPKSSGCGCSTFTLMVAGVLGVRAYIVGLTGDGGGL